MRYFIIAGEASGDLHASNLIRYVKQYDNNAQFAYWGGDLMQEQTGVKPLKHIKELAFMGFVKVLMNIRTIFRNIKSCKEDIRSYHPDVVILVDYPGFNLRLTPFIKSLNIPIFYYISPTVWAWKASRAEIIKKFVDRLYTILPFEPEFYEKYQYKAEYFGHPLLDAIANYKKEKAITLEEFRAEHQLDERPIVALLPGSRVQEIKIKLPLMLKMIERFPNYQFAVSVAPTLELEFIKSYTKSYPVQLVVNKTYDLLRFSHSALVTSGTATLETALFKVPQVVCYKGDALSFSIAKRIVNVKYISLVNLILDKESVRELIQNDFTEKNLQQELSMILDGNKREAVLSDYDLLAKNLGGEGASERVAHDMYNQLLTLINR
ncbi:MAG: lipid-A-disaccharide synthase [Bacteroidales bacterium]|nr:lipid-A-disaccharide synthase [Bacteroidales bacterium]